MHINVYFLNCNGCVHTNKISVFFLFSKVFLEKKIGACRFRRVDIMIPCPFLYTTSFVRLYVRMDYTRHSE
jgi:hypothetical protein